ncbi:LysM peptidoglycan-binding domain-containing protein [Aquincola sp. S2]|uniref:LysM peptidoglycan-binding domain-containing protein n=1 Tax=Pseudaquabacterium terrae TaxID=2732868 RepID=A0ABX2EDM7_9BURK|nr:LysM domain-containing protein [Aquabacterium terrae]NRF66437.1 LysM peptidoglycan-binding domain-containing protein [Aquabacterium terrae]
MTSRCDLRRLTALLVGVGLVAGCAQPPGSGAAPPAPRPAAPAPGGGPAPAPGTAPSDTGAPSSAAAPLSPQAIQKAVTSSIELLEAGHEDQAAAELQRVLQSDPGHKLAQSLMRQIKDDPVAMLGRESFSYRVQPGESLSRIAQRFLNDVHQFYILARYNDIKVPRQLAGGQVIRVPGKAPPPAAPVPPAPAPVATAPPRVPPAPTPAASAPTAPDPAAEADKAARARTEAITRHTRAARSAFAKQDLNGAIRAWDSVLELDPNNRTAQLERQKAIDLKEKLTKVK